MTADISMAHRKWCASRLRRKSGRGAFTLIELLVVIAIISLLVSILLPSLTKAKDLAKSVVCSTRLRSLGVSTQLYLEQSDGVYPLFFLTQPTYTEDNRQIPHWQLFLLWAMGEADEEELWSRGNDSEKKNREIFHCPSDPNETCDLVNWTTSGYVYIFSYGGNTHLGVGAPQRMCSVDDVREPARVFLLTDMNFGSWGRHCLNKWESGLLPALLGRRHPRNEAFNVLFCDGHVENQEEDLYEEQFDPLFD